MPEVLMFGIHGQLDGLDLTDKVDVWAFGVLMWEIVCEQVPWASKGNSLDALKRSVCSQGACESVIVIIFILVLPILMHRKNSSRILHVDVSVSPYSIPSTPFMSLCLFPVLWDSTGERLPLPTADRFPQGWRAQYIKMMEMTWAKVPASRPGMVCQNSVEHVLLFLLIRIPCNHSQSCSCCARNLPVLSDHCSGSALWLLEENTLYTEVR